MLEAWQEKAQQPVGCGAVILFTAALQSGLKLEKAHPVCVPLCLTAVQLIEKYRRCGFSKVWFASAFKGATGVNQSLTLIGHHLRNQLEWLQVASRSPADVLEGIALTGWQRWGTAFCVVPRVTDKQTSTQKLPRRCREAGDLEGSLATLQSFLSITAGPHPRTVKGGFQSSSQLYRTNQQEQWLWGHHHQQVGFEGLNGFCAT